MITEIESRKQVGQLFPKRGIGVELGVMRGENARNLFDASDPEVMYLVDFWTWNSQRDGFAVWLDYKREVQEMFAKEITEGRVLIIDSTFEIFLSTFDLGTIDWAYVDGWHSYYDVKRDFGHLIPKVKLGGIIAGHDLVVEPSDWRTGTLRAVFELVQEGTGEVIGLSNERYCDYVIRRHR